MTNLDKPARTLKSFLALKTVHVALPSCAHSTRGRCCETFNLIANLKAPLLSVNVVSAFSYSNQLPQQLCSICANLNRDQSKLLVAERDNDTTPIEFGVYEGLYFVLGGTIPSLKKRGNGGGSGLKSTSYGFEHGRRSHTRPLSQSDGENIVVTLKLF